MFVSTDGEVLAREPTLLGDGYARIIAKGCHMADLYLLGGRAERLGDSIVPLLAGLLSKHSVRQGVVLTRH